MSYYYKKQGMLLHKAPDWSIRKYGFDHESKGDSIFRTSLYAIANNNEIALIVPFILLREGKRWPNSLSHPLDKNYRSQKSLTRDPFIMWISAAYILKYHEYDRIKKHIPIWLYRPYVNNWINYLTTKQPKYKRRFERQLMRVIKWGEKTEKIKTFLHKRNWFIRGLRHKFGVHSYSLHLWAWMSYVADSNKVREMLFERIPEWNHLLWGLIGCKVIGPEYYQAREGYQWTNEKFVDYPLLPETDDIKLDKDILEWVINRNNA